MDHSEKKHLDCSIVVPLYNEEAVAEELYCRLTTAMKQTGLSYDIIFVNDGSQDRTLDIIRAIAEKDPAVIAVELRRNFGQTPALAAGFDLARGQIVISMDGDLQNLPEEIPSFLEKINEGYDVVSGWRTHRMESMVMRKIPSRAANWIASKISGVEIHDFGTTYKAYRREILDGLRLYGEMHRFIPALLSQIGARIVEIPIRHVPRPAGVSKYGISRVFRVFFDLIALSFLLHYITRPIQYFGKAAFYCGITSMAMLVYIGVDKFYYSVPISVGHLPLAGVAAVLFLSGLFFISSGLIGELISRIYFEATGKTIYSVRRIYSKENREKEKK